MAGHITHAPQVPVYDQVFYLDGSVTTERLHALKHLGVRSVLSVAAEVPGDNCYEHGFDALKAEFPENHVVYVPLVLSHPEFAGNNDALEYPWQSINIYRKFEDALDLLPRPTAIFCKSGRRAGAVFAAYRAVKNNLSKHDTDTYAVQHGLAYLQSSPGLTNWVHTVVDALVPRNQLIFYQLFEAKSSTYTYLLGDPVSREAIIIDPVVDTAERDAQLVRDLNLTLKFALNTHVHADHITGTGKLKTLLPGVQSVIAEVSTAAADVKLREYDVVSFGSRSVIAVSTPGHTVGCLTYVLDDLSAVFTGDTVLIRGCGRTDFQGGSAADLYDNIHTKLFGRLPDSTIVYPAHDYQGRTHSSIGEERRLNPRLTKSKEEFIEIMKNLNLARPAQIDVAVPANLVCGLY